MTTDTATDTGQVSEPEMGPSFICRRLIREIRAEDRWPSLFQPIRVGADSPTAGLAAAQAAEADKFDRQQAALIDGWRAEHAAHADRATAAVHRGRRLSAPPAPAEPEQRHPRWLEQVHDALEPGRHAAGRSHAAEFTADREAGLAPGPAAMPAQPEQEATLVRFQPAAEGPAEPAAVEPADSAPELAEDAEPSARPAEPAPPAETAPAAESAEDCHDS